MNKFFRSIDTILWERKTHRPPTSPTPDVEFVNEPVGAFGQRLRAQPGKHIWIMGGGGLIASFLDEGEIDEFIIHVIPTFIGEGIPLIEARHRLSNRAAIVCHSWYLPPLAPSMMRQQSAASTSQVSRSWRWN